MLGPRQLDMGNSGYMLLGLGIRYLGVAAKCSYKALRYGYLSAALIDISSRATGTRREDQAVWQRSPNLTDRLANRDVMRVTINYHDFRRVPPDLLQGVGGPSCDGVHFETPVTKDRLQVVAAGRAVVQDYRDLLKPGPGRVGTSYLLQ